MDLQLDSGLVVGAVALLLVGLALGGALLLWKPVAEEPAHYFDEAADERRNKRRKPRDKKATSNGQVVHEAEVKAKKSPESGKKSEKKSPAKEKKQKEKPVEVKPQEKKQKKETVEKTKKPKEVVVKPDDYDDGEWEKVPTKSDKKKSKKEEEKKESPVKDKKKAKESKKDEVKEEAVKVDDKPESNPIPKDLQDKVNELQRILSEVEKRDRSQTPVKNVETPVSSAPATPDVRDKKKKEKKISENDESPPPQKTPKVSKKQSSEDSDDAVIVDVPVVKNGDEPEESWTDAKAVKKGKKKPRKDQ